MLVDFHKASERLRAQKEGGMMDQDQAEKESALYTTPAQNEDEIFIELRPGEHIDCAFSEMQQPSGRMSSPLLHGHKVIVGENFIISLDETMPIKMWAARSLEQAYTNSNGRLLGQFVRIRRLEDVQIGGTMTAKTYRISSLKNLLVMLAKDKPVK